MEATERFAHLMRLPEAHVPLDEAALLIAAHAHPGLVLDVELRRLDELASSCSVPTLDGLTRHLFVEQGFCGNVLDYYDPRNSYLDDVLTRRTGIPISLAVLALAVGRRLGVPLAGVGMPGHFLLQDKVDPEVFIDPFARGAVLDRDGCEAAFRAVHGPRARFDPSYLEPVGTFDIVGRMLANLRSVFVRRNDRSALAWVLDLRLRVPGVSSDERADLAAVLRSIGRFADAAHQLDLLGEQLGGELGSDYHRSADRLRARLN